MWNLNILRLKVKDGACILLPETMQREEQICFYYILWWRKPLPAV